jgi:hypothetical protein
VSGCGARRIAGRRWKVRKLYILSSTAILIALCASLAYGQELSARVNIALADGTVMLYVGSGKGVNVGDEFEVTRGSQRVGHIRVIRVRELFSYCEIVQGEAREMDTVTRVKEAPPSAANVEEQNPAAAEQKPAESEEAGRTTRTKRHDRAVDEENKSGSGETPGAAGAGRTASAGSEKKEKSGTGQDHSKKNPPAGEPGKKIRGLPPIGAAQATALGLSGAIFTPSANTIANDTGSLMLYYSKYNKDSDDDFDMKSTGAGFAYNLGGDIEGSFMYISTKMDSNSNASDASDANFNTNILSFKYQMKNTEPPGFLAKNVKEVRYAAGFQYFMYDTSDAATASEDSGSNVNRFFLVGTGKLSGAYVNAGVYYQGGDLDDDNEGLGVMGSAEFPLIKDTQSEIDQLTGIVELDQKAFYTGTYRTLSLGLRYTFAKSSHIKLAVADVTSSQMLVLNGVFNF